MASELIDLLDGVDVVTLESATPGGERATLNVDPFGQLSILIERVEYEAENHPVVTDLARVVFDDLQSALLVGWLRGAIERSAQFDPIHLGC